MVRTYQRANGVHKGRGSFSHRPCTAFREGEPQP